MNIVLRMIATLAVWAVATHAQTGGASLASFTVPQDRLPTGCRMKPIAPPDKPATQAGATRVTAM